MDGGISFYIMLASAAASAAAAVSAGQQSKAASEAEGQRMQQAADVAIRDGMARDDQARAEARRQLGLQLASSAEAGGGLNEDSLRQSIYDAELDSASIRYGAMSQGQGLNDQASVTRWKGRQAEKAGYLNAATSLLSGAGSAYGMKGKTSAKPSTKGVE